MICPSLPPVIMKRRHHQRVEGDRRLDAGDRRAHVLGDGRDRHVHHRGVEHHQELAGAERHQHQSRCARLRSAFDPPPRHRPRLACPRAQSSCGPRSPRAAVVASMSFDARAPDRPRRRSSAPLAMAVTVAVALAGDVAIAVLAVVLVAGTSACLWVALTNRGGGATAGWSAGGARGRGPDRRARHQLAGDRGAGPAGRAAWACSG